MCVLYVGSVNVGVSTTDGIGSGWLSLVVTSGGW